MKTKNALLLASLLMFVCNTVVLAAPGMVWKIKYGSGPFTGGSTTVYLARDAIKLRTASKYEIYAKAPDWNATMYSLKAHAMCTVPVSSYTKGRFLFENEDSQNDLNPSKAISTENITLFGIPAKRRSWNTVSMDPSYYRIRDKQEEVVTQLCTTTKIPHHKMQIALLAAWIPIPHLDAVPITLYDRHKNGRIQGKFSAISIEQIPASQADFRPPTGCRKVERTSQLITAQYANVIDTFLEDAKDVDRKRKNKSPR